MSQKKFTPVKTFGTLLEVLSKSQVGGWRKLHQFSPMQVLQWAVKSLGALSSLSSQKAEAHAVGLKLTHPSEDLMSKCSLSAKFEAEKASKQQNREKQNSLSGVCSRHAHFFLHPTALVHFSTKHTLELC